MCRLGFAQQVRQVSEGPSAGPGTPRRKKTKVSMCREGEILSHRVRFRISVTCMMKASSRRSLVRGMMEKKLEDIPNGGPVSLMRYAKQRSCTVKAGESSPQGSESLEVMATCETKSESLVVTTEVPPRCRLKSVLRLTSDRRSWSETLMWFLKMVNSCSR